MEFEGEINCLSVLILAALSRCPNHSISISSFQIRIILLGWAYRRLSRFFVWDLAWVMLGNVRAKDEAQWVWSLYQPRQLSNVSKPLTNGPWVNSSVKPQYSIVMRVSVNCFNHSSPSNRRQALLWKDIFRIFSVANRLRIPTTHHCFSIQELSTEFKRTNHDKETMSL